MTLRTRVRLLYIVESDTEGDHNNALYIMPETGTSLPSCDFEPENSINHIYTPEDTLASHASNIDPEKRRTMSPVVQASRPHP